MTYKPRGKFVLVRVKEAGVTEKGLHMPEGSAESKQFFVEAIGDEVNPVTLKVGDRVLIRGGEDAQFWPLPRVNDLVIVNEEHIVLIYER